MSHGDAIHDKLVDIIRQSIQASGKGVGYDADQAFFAFALLVPIAQKADQPLVEELLQQSDSNEDLIGDLVHEAMPCMIARFFKQPSATETLEWIDRVLDQQGPDNYAAGSPLQAIRMAVIAGDLDRSVAIDALVHLLRKRVGRGYDLQSAMIVLELLNLSAKEMEAVDKLVLESFEKEQIDESYLSFECWVEGMPLEPVDIRERTWSDPVEKLISWCFDFVSDDLDPVGATYPVNKLGNRSYRLSKTSVLPWIEQLRQSNDENFPREAVESLHLGFADAYEAIIALLREELDRFSREADSWSGNGAYLSLVLTVVAQMPLPVDLLEAILQMPQADREQVFGDQFGLVVQAVATTPQHEYGFVEQWIWDAQRSAPDRREMVGFYVPACENRLLDRAATIQTLATGLRRALQEVPMLIAPYAEQLAHLASPEHAELLSEAFDRDDVDFSVPLDELRQIAADGKAALKSVHESNIYYRKLEEVLSDGVMFRSGFLTEKAERLSAPSRSFELEPQAIPAPSTIRNDARTGRNDPCPCGSGKKYKKCCLK